MYENKVEDIMRTVMEYVKTIRAATATGTVTGTGTRSDQLTISVELDSGGFPIAPSPSLWDKVSKDDLEKTYRSYITHHYRAFFPIWLFSNINMI